jgi:hypothetical protein
MTTEEREDIRAWMAIPENIGAFCRALLATQLRRWIYLTRLAIHRPLRGGWR